MTMQQRGRRQPPPKALGLAQSALTHQGSQLTEQPTARTVAVREGDVITRTSKPLAHRGKSSFFDGPLFEGYYSTEVRRTDVADTLKAISSARLSRRSSIDHLYGSATSSGVCSHCWERTAAKGQRTCEACQHPHVSQRPKCGATACMVCTMLKPISHLKTTCRACRKAVASPGCELCHSGECLKSFVPRSDLARYVCADTACKFCRVFRSHITRKCLLCKESIPAAQGCRNYCFTSACKQLYKNSPASFGGFLPYRCGNSACRTCHITRDGRRLCLYCNLPSGVTCGLCDDLGCKERLTACNISIVQHGGLALPTRCHHPACPVCRPAIRSIRSGRESERSRTVFTHGGLVPLKASKSSDVKGQPRNKIPGIRLRFPIRT